MTCCTVSGCSTTELMLKLKTVGCLSDQMWHMQRNVAIFIFESWNSLKEGVEIIAGNICKFSVKTFSQMEWVTM